MSGTNLPPAAGQPAGGVAYDDDPSLSPRSREEQPPVHSTCRKVFWAFAGFGWVVWVLAVAAAGDEHWGELPTGDGFGVGTGFVEDACDGGDANDSFCSAHENFAACQIVAAVMCSAAVMLTTVAFFRPFEAKRGSSKTLGLVGGVFMALFAFFQMVSFLFLAKSIQEYNAEWARLGGAAYEANLGDTYGVGIAAFLAGIIQAVVTLALFRQAGHGPLLPCAQRISAADDMGAQKLPSSSAAVLLTVNV